MNLRHDQTRPVWHVSSEVAGVIRHNDERYARRMTSFAKVPTGTMS
jgi:hypothetical protein